MFIKIGWVVLMTSLHISDGDGGSVPFPDLTKGLQQLSSDSVEPVPCGYMDMVIKYSQACKKNYLDSIFEQSWGNGLITGRKFLKHISAACSHYDSYRKCASCTAKHDCPDERATLFEHLMGKWSVFCDDSQVAEWLQRILQKEFSYNTSCDDQYNWILYTCLVKITNEQEDFNSTTYAMMSLSEGLARDRNLISAISMCTVADVLENSLTNQSCGSTWQDILLAQWLKTSTVSSVGTSLSDGEVKMLQNMRC